MSLCDRCYDPGRCCRSMALITNTNDIPFAEVFARQADVERAGGRLFPFVLDEQKNREMEADNWVTCPEIQPNGRCGIYNRRPGLCRSFAPQSSELCIHAHGTEAGDPTLDAAFEMLFVRDRDLPQMVADPDAL